MKQLVLNLAAIPQPSLENFVAGTNAEALTVLQAALSGESTERLIYLWGGTGCGKTHLLRAFAHAALVQGLRCVAASAPDIWAAEETGHYDVLVLDAIQRLDEAGQQNLFNILNQLRAGTGILLVSGPYAPTHLNIRPDLSSRLAQGLVLQVKCLSDEDKAAALMSHARTRGFTLPRDVASYLLKKWKRDLPSLMAVLDALDRYSLELKRPITVPLTREALALLSNSGKEAAGDRERADAE